MGSALAAPSAAAGAAAGAAVAASALGAAAAVVAGALASSFLPADDEVPALASLSFLASLPDLLWPRAVEPWLLLLYGFSFSSCLRYSSASVSSLAARDMDASGLGPPPSAADLRGTNLFDSLFSDL